MSKIYFGESHKQTTIHTCGVFKDMDGERYEFTLKEVYDEEGYKVLSEVTWEEDEPNGKETVEKRILATEYDERVMEGDDE